MGEERVPLVCFFPHGWSTRGSGQSPAGIHRLKLSIWPHIGEDVGEAVVRDVRWFWKNYAGRPTLLYKATKQTEDVRKTCAPGMGAQSIPRLNPAARVRPPPPSPPTRTGLSTDRLIYDAEAWRRSGTSGRTCCTPAHTRSTTPSARP
jgi:hypothetical protein